jgi:SAM-dependent methyltransferase
LKAGPADGTVKLTTTYQRMTLPDGTVLPGHDRSYLNESLFGDGIEGRSYLDIGCFHGYFCLEALRRGARRSAGIESYRESVQAARAIASTFGLSPEYIEADFEEWNTDERFDVISCLNVMHHLYDPIHALRRMVDMAREKLVLEIAVPTFKDLRRRHISPLTALAARSEPLIALGLPSDDVDLAQRTFIFTPAALKVMLNRHYLGFEPVRIVPSGHKGRMLVTARKRRIETLTVVAGPTAAGKSTLIRRLQSDAALRERLSLPGEISAVATPGTVPGLPAGELRHVILNYDLMRPYGGEFRAFLRDPAATFIRQARNVNFLTILTPQARLLEQLGRAELRAEKPATRRARLEDLYRKPEILKLWYDAWGAFCGSFETARQQVVVENTGEFRSFPWNGWEALFDSRFSPSK